MDDLRFARRVRAAGNPRGREFSVEFGDQSQLRAMRVWHVRMSPGAVRHRLTTLGASSSAVGQFADDQVGPHVDAIVAMQLVWLTEDLELLHSPAIGAVGAEAGQPMPPHDDTVLGDDDVINGIYGFHSDAGLITGVGLITQHGDTPMLGTPVGDKFRLALEHLPAQEFPGALVTGLCGHFDHDGLTSLGLRVNVDGVGPLVVQWGPGGRIVPRHRTAGTPAFDPARVPASPSEHPKHADRVDHLGPPTPERARPNPNYERVDVRRVEQWDDVLRIHSGGLDGGRSSSHDFRYVERRYDPRHGLWTNVFRDTSGNRLGDVVVHLDPDDPWIELPHASSGTFARPHVPLPAASDGPTWANVFSLDHRGGYLGWSSRGIDVTRLAPFDIQASNGALREQVFATPDPGGRDFHVDDTGRATMVPNGWKFVGHVAGTTGSRTASAFSEEESRQTWATSLGFSAEADGFGAKAAYKNNSKAHGELSQGSSGKVVTTIIEETETSHSLIVDLATVELAAGFRAAVESAAADPTRQAIGELLMRFGTHVAHAVTFGTKQWEQRHETEQSARSSVARGTSGEQSVEVGYHNEIGGASASVSTGSEDETSRSTSAGTGSEISSRGSIGNAGEPVPILMDLLDITDLLSPAFFDDPFVYSILRPKVSELIDEYPLGDFDTTAGALDFHIAAPLSQIFGDDFIAFQGVERYVHSGRCYVVPENVTPYISTGPARRFTNFEPSFFARAFVPDPYPATVEGKAVRFRGDDRREWWIRGGHRHHIDDKASYAFLPTSSFTAVPEEDMARFPDSGETVSIDGKLLRSFSDPQDLRVWLIGGDRRHLVPSDDLVEVMGGWEVVAGVHSNYLDRFDEAAAPATVDNRMVRSADSDVVWVIHRGRRHRTGRRGIAERGGLQQVAVVPDEVLAAFPESSAPPPR